jgi:hypothetical protein
VAHAARVQGEDHHRPLRHKVHHTVHLCCLMCVLTILDGKLLDNSIELAANVLTS